MYWLLKDSDLIPSTDIFITILIFLMFSLSHKNCNSRTETACFLSCSKIMTVFYLKTIIVLVNVK